jgi:hypothetical protein
MLKYKVGYKHQANIQYIIKALYGNLIQANIQSIHY